MSGWVQSELFPAEEAGEQKAFDWSFIPRFDKPQNDNELLLNAQHDYLNGQQQGLVRIYELCHQVAYKFIQSIGRTNRHVMGLDDADKREKAWNVGEYMVRRYLEDKGFYVKKNYPGYLYLRVQHELFYQTKAEKLEQYCVDNGMDLFSLTKEHCLEIRNNYEKTGEK